MKRIDNDSATDSDQFTEGNPSTGTPATILSAQFLNVLQEELASLVEMSGQTLDQSGVDTSQIKKAVATAVAGLDFYNAGGTSNAITLSPATGNVAPASYFDGMRVRFKPTADNTSSSTTVKVGTLAAITVRVGAGSGTSAPAETFVDGVDVELIYDGDHSVFKAPAPAEASNLPAVEGSNITFVNSETDAEHDIVFSGGFFAFDDGEGFASNVISETKRIDANFVGGTDQGGLDVGTVAADTWYYCYVISNTGGTTTDYLFTATYDSPTLPSGYSRKRYIGAIRTDSNANIINEIRIGNKVFKKAPIQDLSSTATTTTATLHTLSVPPIDNIEVNISCYTEALGSSSVLYGWITSPLSDDISPVISFSNLYAAVQSGNFRDNQMQNLNILANSGQVRTRFNTTLGTISINTISYVDNNL